MFAKAARLPFAAVGAEFVETGGTLACDYCGRWDGWRHWRAARAASWASAVPYEIEEEQLQQDGMVLQEDHNAEQEQKAR